MPRTGDILRIGGRFYRLVPGIGDPVFGKSGSCGLVFAARDGVSAAIGPGPPSCAVKMLNPHSPAGPEAAATALHNEIAMLQAFTRLPAPCRSSVPRLWAADPSVRLPDGSHVPALVIDFCTGTLADLLREGDMSRDAAVYRRLRSLAGLAELAAALASALVTLAGIADRERPFAAHRDVRPANVFVRQGRFILGDFGAGCRYDRGTATLIGFGQDEERPPELRAAARRARATDGVAPAPMDFRPGDIWGIGLCLWRVLFDRLPGGLYQPLKPGDDALAAADRAALRREVAGLPAGAGGGAPTAGRMLEQLIEACLDSRPDGRPTAAAVLARAEAVLGRLARPDLPAPPSAPPRKRRRAIAATAALAALAVSAIAFAASLLHPVAVDAYRLPFNGDLLARWDGHPYHAAAPLGRTAGGDRSAGAHERLILSLRAAPRALPFGETRLAATLFAPDGSVRLLQPPECRSGTTPGGITLECAIAPGGTGSYRILVDLVRTWPLAPLAHRLTVADAAVVMLPPSIRK